MRDYPSHTHLANLKIGCLEMEQDPAVRRSSIVTNFLTGRDAVELQLDVGADVVAHAKESVCI